MLGLVWFLSRATLDIHPAIGVGLAMGWVLMPTFLGLSLRWPGVRYALVIPSSLVSVSLFAICLTALPEDGGASAGWLLIAAGVLFGGVLGIWFWYRRFPVPNGLQDPFSSGRWALIAVHVGLIVVGLALVSLSALI